MSQVVRARFQPRCGRPHFAPTRSGVRVCGRNRTEAREREWAEGTVSSLPGTRVVLDSFFRADSTLTHMTIQVTQLRLNSNPKFANMTQL